MAVRCSSRSPWNARCAATSTRTFCACSSSSSAGSPTRAAQQRADAGEQLGEPERLGDVVVGAGVEPDDEVDLVGARGEHEDRGGQAVVADRTRDVEAVHVRQTEVEDDEVGRRGTVDRTLTRALHAHVVTFTTEGASQRLGNRRVVLCQQHLGHSPMLGHGTVLTARPGRAQMST